MSARIYSKRLGINRCYVIRDKSCIMIDAGPPRSGPKIEGWLKTIKVRPQDIQLVVLTHGHFDHAGSAVAVREITGAKIAIHEFDRQTLEGGTASMPSAVTAWGRVGRVAMMPLKPVFRFPGTQADVILRDDEIRLSEYGISGRVIHTPGHTPGSVSVLLDTGEAFAGCMAHNGLPFRLKPGLPIFAEDLRELKESWRLLLEHGAETVYPGHGDPFPAAIIREALS
jgi:glyoxylase-like metal-dependent hydrolase (beta-lactamase superfamily II)